MKSILSCILLLAVLASCQKEEEYVPKAPAPQLSARGINANNFTFAVTLEENAGEGTFYYVVLKGNEARPAAADIKSHVLSQYMPLAGGNLKTVNMPGCTSKTAYVVYGVMDIEGALSNVTSLNVTTL